jgi:hypothetical protein
MLFERLRPIGFRTEELVLSWMSKPLTTSEFQMYAPTFNCVNESWRGGLVTGPVNAAGRAGHGLSGGTCTEDGSAIQTKPGGFTDADA